MVVLLAVVAGVTLPASTTAATEPGTAAVSSAVVAAADRPNIVLITTDDQAEDDLRFMPFTRRLVGGAGVTFSDAVAPFPLCCPARAMLMTGQLAHNNGVLSNRGREGGYRALQPLNERTLPVWLQKAGYRTTFTGKYLNGYGSDPTEVPAGWDDWHGAVGGIYDFFGNTVNENGVPVDRTGSYQADLTQDVTEQAILTGAATGQPYFVYQSNLAPHAACPRTSRGGCRWSPPQPATQDVDSFQDLTLQREHDGAYNERAVADKPAYIARKAELTAGDERRMLDYQRARARSLQAVDRNVRDTVRLLEDLGELDNTVLIFTSDNGFMLGEHRAFGKILAYEPSLTIPLLMRGPGVPSGLTVDRTVSLVDVAATIADAAGARPMLEQDGRSLLRVANGARGYAAVGIEAGSVLGARAGQFFYRGVRTSRYTYLEYPQTGEAELYDRRVDPDQMDNAAYRPTHRATRRDLAALLDRLRDCAGRECRSVSGSVSAPQRPQGPVHPDELTSIGTATQVVTITGRSWSSRRGRAVAWQKRGRSWRAVRSFPVELGANGMARPGAARHERGRTPAGTFRAVRGYGLAPDPGTDLPYRVLDSDDRWPFDARSPETYSVLQERRPARATWRPRYEEVFARSRRQFRHVLVLDHNLPRRVRHAAFGQSVASVSADVRLGSFLIHTGERVGRHGWVAAQPKQTAWLLRWVDPVQHGTRVVTGPVRHLKDRL
jgi:arylsulfatase A-like enzyme/L,D-peptidoglycan transpeptidase YkuD (ErfK/YbiS/YcfS/YnhG family)